MKLNLNAVRKLLKEQFKKRPILSCVRYEPERIVFTNSYALVKLNVKSPITEPINLNIISLELMSDTYPNVDRIIENADRDKLLVTDINVEVDLEHRVQYYKINDLYFEKGLVDDTFKTVGLDISTVNRKYLFTNKSILVYEDDGVFLLVLRVNKNND
ncbi:MAG TPA: hypothetical protein GX742_00070 [Acholeplasmataceae bacterium]|nr:hypothetical protein [Acholeplasmataceae bacterium]